MKIQAVHGQAMGFPGDSVVKNPPDSEGDLGPPLGIRKIPWGRE